MVLCATAVSAVRGVPRPSRPCPATPNGPVLSFWQHFGSVREEIVIVIFSVRGDGATAPLSSPDRPAAVSALDPAGADPAPLTNSTSALPARAGRQVAQAAGKSVNG